MKALITGYHGMIAPRIAKALKKKKFDVVIFNREEIDINNQEVVLNFLESVKPDYIFHLAYGDPNWSRTMALYCYNHDVKYVYISTVNVYGDLKGPFNINSIPLPNDDYGKYKYECEKVSKDVNPNLYIFRLGWQIASPKESHANNMVNFLLRNQDKDGYVNANANCYLSTSFVEDLGKEIVRVALTLKPDIYLFNSNHRLNVYELYTKVKRTYRLNVKIIKVYETDVNVMMKDERIKLKEF